LEDFSTHDSVSRLYSSRWRIALAPTITCFISLGKPFSHLYLSVRHAR
jgi:hypothetical protein